MQEKSNKSVFINQKGFEQAAVQAHQRYYSTPYQCPNPVQQGERAACLLVDGRVISEVPGNLPELRNKNGSYNLNLLAKYYDSPVKKLVYRPNHDLLHAMRQAALVPEIKAFYDKHIPGKFANMEPKHLERLQLMLLFAVSGRQDETGFSDSDEAKEKYYKQYRKDSALAYLEYAKQCPGLYEGPDAEEQLHRDALLVELMGLPTLKKEVLEDKSYGIINLMSEKNIPIPEVSDPYLNPALDFLNIAHSLDLLRVYPPESTSHANSKKNIDKLFNAAVSEITKRKDLNEDEKTVLIKDLIKDTISLIQYSQKMLNASGEKHPTNVELDVSKIDKILNSEELGTKIVTLIKNPGVYDNKTAITNFIGGEIFTSANRTYDSKRFDYCHYKGNSNRDEDRDFEKDVTSGMNMLNGIQRPKLSTAASAQSNESLNEKQIVINATNELINQANVGKVGIIPRVVGFRPNEDNESKPLESIQFVFENTIQKENFRKNIKLLPNTNGVFDGLDTKWKPIFQIPAHLVTSLLSEMKNSQENLQLQKQEEINIARTLVNQANVGKVKMIPRVVGYEPGGNNQSKPLEAIQFVFATPGQRNNFMKKIGPSINIQGVHTGVSKENKPFLTIHKDLVPSLLGQMQNKQAQEAAQQQQLQLQKEAEINTAHTLVKQTNLADPVGIIPRVVGYEAGKDNESKPLESIQFVFENQEQKERFRVNTGLPPNAEGVFDGFSTEWKPIFQIPTDLVTDLLIQMNKKQLHEDAVKLQKNLVVFDAARELKMQAGFSDARIDPRVEGYNSEEGNQHKPLTSIRFEFADKEQRDKFMKKIGLEYNTKDVDAGESKEKKKPFLQIHPDLVPKLLDQINNKQAQEKAAQKLKSEQEFQKKQSVIATANELRKQTAVFQVRMIPIVVGYDPEGEHNLSKPLQSIQFEFAGIKQKDKFMKETGLLSTTEGVSAGESNGKPFLLIKPDLLPKLLDQMKSNQAKQRAEHLQKKQLVINNAKELLNQPKYSNVTIISRVAGYESGEDNQPKPLQAIQFVFDNRQQRDDFMKENGLSFKDVYADTSKKKKPYLLIDPDLVIQMKNKQDAKKYLENIKTESDALLKELKAEKTALVNKHDPEYNKIVEFTGNLIKELEKYSNEFYQNPSPETFKNYEIKCDQAFEATEDEAKKHRGWANTNSIVKGFVGILAAITIIPAIAVAIKSEAGFLKTFFDTPEQTTTTTSKKVSNFKQRFNAQKDKIKEVTPNFSTSISTPMKPK